MSFLGFAFGFEVYSILKVLDRALDNPRNNEELLKEIKRQNEIIELNSYQLDIVQKVSNQTSLNVDRICTALQEGLDSYKALKHLCIVAFREWLNFDLFDKRDVGKLHKNLSSFSSYLHEFSIKILQYSQNHNQMLLLFVTLKKLMIFS